jgi:hypothetical protein
MSYAARFFTVLFSLLAVWISRTAAASRKEGFNSFNPKAEENP